MLVPAICKKAELLEKFTQEVYSDKYFRFRGYAHDHEIPEIKNEDFAYQYAIVNKSGDVVGYLAYKVDLYTDCVSGFGLYSFGRGDITVGLDVFAKLEELIRHHRRIEWTVVGGNKVKRVYDKFCRKHGGRVIEFRDCIRDKDGNFHNSYVYEIVWSDRYKKLKQIYKF